MRGRADAEEALRPQARAGSYQAASRRSGAAGRQVTAATVVWGLRTVGPRASLRHLDDRFHETGTHGTGDLFVDSSFVSRQTRNGIMARWRHAVELALTDEEIKSLVHAPGRVRGAKSETRVSCRLRR